MCAVRNSLENENLERKGIENIAKEGEEKLLTLFSFHFVFLEFRRR